MRVGEPNANECPNCALLLAQVAELRSILELQRVQLDEQRAEIEKLRAQVTRNSTNSHRPPSSDPPDAPRRQAKKPKSKRKRGGQPGHKGKARSLLPPERVTRIEVCKPVECSSCGAGLKGTDPEPERHQVVDIPPIVAQVVEYELHSLECECGQTTQGRLPDGVSWSSFGPRLVALVAALACLWRMPKRSIKDFMADALGVELSLGSVSRMERTASEALRVPVEEAQNLVREQQFAHLDETGWREANRKAWLWTAVTEFVTVFVIRASRGACVARELLGEAFAGIVISDRWSSYSWLSTTLRQLCWAHLKRDFQKMAEVQSSSAASIGQQLGECCKELFHWWHQVRDGTLTRAVFQDHVSTTLQPRVKKLLETGAECDHGKVAGMCAAILKLESALWTFVGVEGIEPTNNAAERAIRHCVIWRKVCFGTQSSRGSEFAERMLTTMATLRQQRCNVLDYLTAACQAAYSHRPAPPLIPG